MSITLKFSKRLIEAAAEAVADFHIKGSSHKGVRSNKTSYSKGQV